MLKLIRCEFWKLRRKRFVSFVVFAALLFPIPFTALALAGNVGNFSGFDAVFGLLLTLGEPVMLPVVLGIVAAMLFFMEWDNDTLKNLRTIPISPAKLATAKIAVLFPLGLIYSFATLVSSLVGGLIAGSAPAGILEKIALSLITSVLYTASVLPVVIGTVWFNRSYIFSIILTFFYTMFDFFLAYGGVFASPEPAMKLLTNILPAPDHLSLAGGAVCIAGYPRLCGNGTVFFTAVADSPDRSCVRRAFLSGNRPNLQQTGKLR